MGRKKKEKVIKKAKEEDEKPNYCDLIPPIKEFNEEIAKIKWEDPKFATKLSINVFVICCVLNYHIDLQKLYELFYKNPPKEEIIIKFNPKSKKSKGDAVLGIKKKEENNCTFYNSLMMKFVYGKNNISAKIFPNGRIQITGCKTIEKCHEVPKLICRIIRLYRESIQFTSESKLKVIRLKFGMINTKLKVNDVTINQRKLNKIINDKYLWKDNGNWRISKFQQEKYHGINAKYWTSETRDFFLEKVKSRGTLEGMCLPEKIPGQVAVLIFRSGNTIITGAKSINDLKEAYFGFLSLLNKHQEVFIKKKLLNSKQLKNIEKFVILHILKVRKLKH